MLWSVFKTADKPKLSAQNFVISSTNIIFNQDGLILRNQAFSDVENTHDTLMRVEGWPSMLHFWPTIFAVDPLGYYMLEHKRIKVGSISMVCYPSIKFAYIGMYVVDKAQRNQGFGKILFEKILAHTENNRGIATIGLNCYTTMSPIYQAWGFKTYTTDGIWKLSNHTSMPSDSNKLDQFSESLLKQVIDYDTVVFGTERAAFINGMITKPNTATVFAEENKQIQGYGIISQRDPAQPEENASYRIGPLYARNEKIAAEILQRLVAAVNLSAEQSVFLEAPDSNNEATAILKQLGFVRLVGMDKMYRGTPPKFAEDQIFGYTSLAFGG